MRFTIVVFVLLFALVRSQLYDFGSFFSGGLDVSSGARDPRQNRGPITFPQAPADNGETSGVIVGASGYGFVPPSGQQGGRLRRFY